MTASLAITYRRYLIQEGGLLWFVPALLYKAFPLRYEDYTPIHKIVEKVLIICATCQAGQLAFWFNFSQGGGWMDCLLCAGLASVIAHVVDQKYFA
jgi:hypothetical protein